MEKVWGYPDNPYRNGKQVAIGDEAHGRIALGFSRAMGELYEEVRMDHKFDYPTIEKVIDEKVPSHWFIFVSWKRNYQDNGRLIVIAQPFL